MKRCNKKAIVFLLAFMLAIPCVGVVEPKAASKPSLSSKSMTIGIGKYSVGKTLLSGYLDVNTLSVKSAKSGATYSFTSSNKKIVTVKAGKKSATITGVKKGTAKVTVKQKYKGKTTTVGTCKVTVKNASVGKGQLADSVPIGTSVEASYYDVGFIVNIAYINPSAKYTFKSDKSGFTMTQTQSHGGAIQTYTASAGGTYNVTVTETYKGKSKKLGTVKVTVLPISLNSTATIYAGDDNGVMLDSLLENGAYASLVAEVADGDTASTKLESVYGTYTTTYNITCAQAGEFTLNVYLTTESGEKGDFIGSCAFTVKEAKVKEIRYPSTVTMPTNCDGMLYDFAASESGSDDDDEDVDEETSEFGVFMEEENMPVASETYTSSDSSIVKVNEEGYLETNSKTGTVTITVSAGGVTKDVKVIVVDEDDY